MPTVLSYDGQIATVQTDDGRIVKVSMTPEMARQQMAGPTMAPAVSPPTPGPSFPPSLGGRVDDMTGAGRGSQDVGFQPQFAAPAAVPSQQLGGEPSTWAPLPVPAPAATAALAPSEPADVPMPQAVPATTRQEQPVAAMAGGAFPGVPGLPGRIAGPIPWPQQASAGAPTGAPTEAGGAAQVPSVDPWLDPNLTAQEREAAGLKHLADVQAEDAKRSAEVYAKAQAESEANWATEQKLQQEKETYTKEQIAKLTALNDARASKKIDEGHWWASRSTGQKIMAAISIALSGIGNALARQGNAPNSALQIIQGAIKDDINTQLANIDKLGADIALRRGALGDYRDMMGDREKWLEMASAGSWARAKQKVDSIGVASSSEIVKTNAAILSAQMEQQRDAALAAAAAADADKKFKQSIEAARAATDQYQAETGRKQVGLGFAQLKEGARQFNAAQTLDAEKFRQTMADKERNTDIEATKLIQAGDIEGAKALQEEVKANRELGTSDPARGIELRQPPPANAADLNKQADELEKAGRVLEAHQKREEALGARVLFRNATVADAATTALAATTTVSRIIDEIYNMRTAGGGWQSDIGNSAKLQEMRQEWNTAKMILGQNIFALGALSEGDMGLISSALGVGDPTQYRDIGPGILQARKTLGNYVNDKLRANGYEGNWSVPELNTHAIVPDSMADKIKKEFTSNKFPTDAWKARQAYAVGSGIEMPKTDQDKAEYEEAFKNGEVPLVPSARASIDLLAGLAAGGDESANILLRDLALNHRNIRYRAYARGAAAAIKNGNAGN